MWLRLPFLFLVFSTVPWDTCFCPVMSIFVWRRHQRGSFPRKKWLAILCPNAASRFRTPNPYLLETQRSKVPVLGSQQKKSNASLALIAMTNLLILED